MNNAHGQKNYMQLITRKREKANPQKVKNLQDWLKAKRGRISAVSRVMGCTPSNIQNALNMKGGYIPSKDWYLTCKEAARTVEAGEKS